MENMESRNNTIYKAVNLYTIRGPELNMKGKIQDWDVFGLHEDGYVAMGLEEQDDTMKVVDRVDKLIKKCGNMIVENCYFWADSYDEDYNYIEEGDEYNIRLFSSPGLFVDREAYREFCAAGIKYFKCIDYRFFDSFDQKKYIEMFDTAFKGKVPLIISAHPSTFLGKQFGDLEKEGINVRREKIFGVVDIQKMCEELQKRGINIELDTNSLSDNIKKFEERFASGDEDYEPPRSAPLTSFDFDTYVKNLFANGLFMYTYLESVPCLYDITLNHISSA
jgi:hypothetical protein